MLSVRNRIAHTYNAADVLVVYDRLLEYRKEMAFLLATLKTQD